MNEFFTASDTAERWYALHTKSRREKRVAGVCAELGIRHYLPLRKSITRSRGRTFQFDVPLFPGYLFCCCDWEGRYRMLRTNHVASALEIGDEERLLGELRSIHLALEAETDLIPCPHLKRGTPARVVRGALKGVEGVVARRQGSFRLVLKVSFLGSSVMAEVDVGDLEAL